MLTAYLNTSSLATQASKQAGNHACMHARLIDGKSSLLAFSLMALSFPVRCFSCQLLHPKRAKLMFQVWSLKFRF